MAYVITDACIIVGHEAECPVSCISLATTSMLLILMNVLNVEHVQTFALLMLCTGIIIKDPRSFFII